MRDSKENSKKPLLTCHKKPSFSAEVGEGQYFMTKLSINNSEGSTLVCREYTLLCSNRNSQSVCAFKDDVRINEFCSIEVLIPPKQNLPNCSWVHINRGFYQYASQIFDLEYFVSEKL